MELKVGVHSSLIPYVSGMGVGLRANETIAESSTLIYVPEARFISLERVLKRHPLWASFPKTIQSEVSILALFVARVRAGIDTAENDKKKVFHPIEYLYILYMPDE